MLATMVEHVIGIDPDRDRVTAAVVDTATTGEQASGVFGTTQMGYDRLLKWADQHTQAAGRVWSVEGAGSYGAGVAGYLIARGEMVTEFNDPTPTRDGAKTDALDARRAARQVLGRLWPSVPARCWAACGHLSHGLGETAKLYECWRPPAGAPKGPEYRLSTN